jgi:hypothetical protein
VAQLHSAPCNGGEASSGVALQDAREGTKGVKKRCEQRLQQAATTANEDGGSGNQAGSSDVVCVGIAIGSGKHQAQPAIDDFEKLLEEAC